MFENEEEYLMSLKQEDSYHFTIPFEYIKKNYGNDDCDMAETNMEVDVEWSDYNMGYKISYYAPDMDSIDPDEGNGDVDEFYDAAVRYRVMEELEFMGITGEALVGGDGLG